MPAVAARKVLTSLDGRHARDRLIELLPQAGVRIDGPDPWDLQVKDDRMWMRVLRDGTLGFAEAYLDGWWECPRIDLLVERLWRARLDEHVKDNWVLIAYALK